MIDAPALVYALLAALIAYKIGRRLILGPRPDRWMTKDWL